MENSPWKRLWTYHKAHYRSGEITSFCALTHLITRDKTLQLWKSKCESQLCVHHTKPKHPCGARDHMTESSKRDRCGQLSLSGAKLKIDVYRGDSLRWATGGGCLIYTRCFAGWQYSRDDAFPYVSCQSKPPTLPLKSNHASVPEQGKSFLLISKTSRSALEPTQPSTHWVPGTLSYGVKRPGREAVWSPLCRLTVTNDSQYVIRSWHVSSRTQWQLRRVANGKYSLEEENDTTPATSYISQWLCTTWY